MDENKKFGAVLGGALIVLGGIFYWHEHTGAAQGFFLAGFICLAGVLIAPQGMKYPRKFLQGFGWLNSQLILILIYYLVFSPVGFVRRLLKKDPLGISWKIPTESYWVVRSRKEYNPERYHLRY